MNACRRTDSGVRRSLFYMNKVAENGFAESSILRPDRPGFLGVGADGGIQGPLGQVPQVYYVPL
jgi:hypothetical protein